MNRTLTPVFGIWDLDALIQVPKTDTHSAAPPPPFVLAIEGPVGSGKSTLALHLAAQFLQRPPKESETPVVIMVSTDWRLSQAMGVWDDFNLNQPPEKRQPYSSHVDQAASDSWKEAKIRPLVLESKGGSVGLVDWLADLLAPQEPEKTASPVLYFLDLSDTDVGDEWLLLERLLALIQLPPGRPGLVIVDSVPGMQSTSGERDHFGQVVPSDERIGRLVKAAAGKCSLAFTTAATDAPAKATKDEGQCDFIYRIEIIGREEDPQRFIRLAKARGHQHSLGRHLLEVRSRHGYFSSSSEDPDNRPWHCEYIQVTPSIASLSDAIKRAAIQRESTNETLNAFGIRYLDTLLEVRQSSPKVDGDAFGVRCGRIVSISGEAGTHKSEVAMAFAKHTFADPARLILSLLESCFGKSSLLDSYDTKVNDFWRVTRSRWLSELKVESKDEDGLSTLAAALAKVGCAEQELEPSSKVNKDWWSRLEKRALESLILREGTKNLARCAIVVSTRYMEHGSIAEDIAESLVYRYEHQIRNLTEPISNAHLRGQWNAFLTKGLQDLLKKIVVSNLVYRRLSGRELSPAVALNAIRRCVERTVARLDDQAHSKADSQVWLAGLNKDLQPRIRLVVDDLHAITLESEAGEYHEFRNLLNTYLRTRLVSSVLVETNAQSGLGRSPYGRQDQEISIKTWRVRFESGDRVAIAVEPAVQADAHGIVRELRLVPLKGTQQPEKNLRVPLVDPDFELYANLPAGSPKLVPLEVRLYAETEAWTNYCAREEEFLKSVVRVPMPGEPKEVSQIINLLPRASYRLLQDLCTLPNSANLPSTVVLQVDGFWALQRAGDLRNLYSYLTRYVNVGLPTERVLEDQFLAHRQVLSDKTPHRGGKRRANRFESPGIYESRIRLEDTKADRVPLMWDMGFLMIDAEAWRYAKDRKFQERIIDPQAAEQKSDSKVVTSLCDVQVSRVLKDLFSLPTKPDEEPPPPPPPGCSWRRFLGACVEVARAEEQRIGKKVAPLALSSVMPNSMDCLVLEIWLSEIILSCRSAGFGPLAERLISRFASTKFNDDDNAKDPNQLIPLRYGLLDLLGSINLEKQTCARGPYSQHSISSALKEFRNNSKARNFSFLAEKAGFVLQLYQTWLLLLEAFNTSTRSFGGINPPEEELPSVAVRHWYKTACATGSKPIAAGSDTISWEPRGLPGHFITRGDWYLGIAKGSRSVRLGELTLDALTDDASNRQRLDLGIGLPVVNLINNSESTRRIPTALKVRQPYGWSNVTLGELRDLGGYSCDEMRKMKLQDHQDRLWLWRSELGGYDWQSRPFKRWLHRVMDWSAKYRFDHQDRWDGGGGFKGYDDIAAGIAKPKMPDAFSVVRDYESFIEFGRLCDDLCAELASVTPAQ